MRYITAAILAAGVLWLSACDKTPATGEKEDARSVIRLGTNGADADIWRFIAKGGAAEKAGIKLEVENIEDGVALNSALADGTIDVNAFQSRAYFESYNARNPGRLAVLATTYYEPMGIYSSRHKTLADIPDGATVAVPNDAANHVRALRLLQTAGLIALPEQFDSIAGSYRQISGNPKHLKFAEVKYAQGPRVLPDVDLSVIGNTAALESGLQVFRDAIFYEPLDESVQTAVNILAVRREDAGNPNLQALAKLYHSPEVKTYIAKNLAGSKVLVDSSGAEK